MREEHAPPQEHMRLVPRHALEALQQRLVDPARAELLDQLVVVDRELLAVGRDGALHVPGRDNLCLCVCGLDRFGRGCGGGGRLSRERC